tara:strand:- start:353 stop:838 length:486 start_codon:yes stop_codon:yes gene_type:complete
MDTLSHAFWSRGLFGYRGNKWLPVFFGVMPDLISFGSLFIIKFFNGTLSYSGAPTLESLSQLAPYPDWLFFMDNLSHSFITAFICITIVYYLNRNFVWPMLAWPFHILLDFSFHTKDFFPVKLFWPISDYSVNGISWSSPEVWFPNLAGIILLFWYRKKDR